MATHSGVAGRLLTTFLLLGSVIAAAQVFTVTTEQVPSRFLQFQPTDVKLPKMHAGPFTLERLERSLASEKGYAMRPLPLASHGLILTANGPLSPSGAKYVQELDGKGIAAHPGDAVTITKIVFHRDRIVFDFNGGPDVPHKYLRHIELGAGMAMMPLAVDRGEQPTGTRLTLVFPGGVPNVTGDEVKELLAPVVGFGEKSPAQSYAETLPPLLRNAILDHHVLVGMNADMVLHAVGAPGKKMHEQDGQELFVEWIYGTPPQKSEFVRFQGFRVTRVEDAAVGMTPVIRTENEVGDYWETAEGRAANERLIRLGDPSAADRADQSMDTSRPTLRKTGETLPSDSNPGPSMKPVQFPTSAPSSPSGS